ncbi:MAG TPA: DUF6714 family protein [Tepidisphaeraceae bacterium]|jgi:hypothetical protein|nr:DUF6714 family protein [Tepidisphaeraceae bacterium]
MVSNRTGCLMICTNMAISDDNTCKDSLDEGNLQRLIRSAFAVEPRPTLENTKKNGADGLEIWDLFRGHSWEDLPYEKISICSDWISGLAPTDLVYFLPRYLLEGLRAAVSDDHGLAGELLGSTLCELKWAVEEREKIGRTKRISGLTAQQIEAVAEWLKFIAANDHDCLDREEAREILDADLFRHLT